MKREENAACRAGLDPPFDYGGSRSALRLLKSGFTCMNARSRRRVSEGPRRKNSVRWVTPRKTHPTNYGDQVDATLISESLSDGLISRQQSGPRQSQRQT